MDKLKILFLIKPFDTMYAKHKQKFESIREIEKFATVRYWYEDGNILEILKKLNFQPDCIVHYDIAWGYAFAPRITGLDQVDIPKGCFVLDKHYSKETRIEYIESNKIDIIFSRSKQRFIEVFPQYSNKLRWLPFSINPEIMKDWKLKKDITYLLMGQVFHKSRELNKSKTREGRYPFRESVLKKMQNVKGFVFRPHPGHRVAFNKDLYVDIKYAKELNRSKMFFTCGSEFKIPVLKFFEALACNTLLLAEANQDIYELGFKDGVHFVACNKSNFLEKAMYYKENRDERRRISKKGYKFVQKYHTNNVRAKQFVQYIKDFIKENKKN
ncbi:glycosyltransferase [Paenibacillus sp. JNUCC32]|uniref:glycosyltransferase n=1 Tax=Paenibacillus sp. JNUCC32 TaxID=2777984 RepID=UPI0017887048|nr:glycosyltransferase [Paenibacillus sp. JNUCC-32]QOT08097.1 glycosyltransferase [Paenibacillus sp. JNUCC-32]